MMKKEIADVVELYLQNEYHVLKFYTGQEALECIEKTNVDLAILDVMLPDIDGFTILRKIREKYISGDYVDREDGVSGQDHRAYDGG